MTTHHDDVDSDEDFKSARSSTRHSSTFTSGRDFYDDGYCDEELDANDIPCKLDFKKIPFFGRQHEILQLRKAYHDVIGVVDDDGSGERGTLQKKRAHSAKQSKKETKQEANGFLGEVPASARPTTTFPAVLLWGLSGTGKSRLVQHFVHQEVRKDEHAAPYIIQGKYDESTGGHDPFSAISQALNDFCRQVQAGPDEERRRVRSAIQQAVGKEVNTLIKLAPAVKDLLQSNNSSGDAGPGQRNTNGLNSTKDTDLSSVSQSSIQSNDSEFELGDTAGTTMITGTDTAWNRLQYTFVSFVEAIATKERPIMMFLDDLQWSSQVSMDLLTTMLLIVSSKNKSSLQHFLLIGAIRQELNPHANEVLELSSRLPLSIMLETLRKAHQQVLADTFTGVEVDDDSINGKIDDSKTPQPWTDVNLTNMSIDDVGLLLSHLLGKDVEQVQSLTTKVFDKTEGNVFFTLQLLEQLERCNILVYSRITFQWEWDWSDDSDNEGSLREALTSSDNVLQLVAMKIRHLSAELRTALTIASYIRSSFDLKVLQVLLESEWQHAKHNRTIDDFAFSEDAVRGQQALADLLEGAVLDGMLTNTIGGTTYKFGHDRIQQAAYGLVSFGEERNKLRQRIGLALLDLCQKGSEEIDTSALMFVAADHLNNSPSKDHLSIVKLNLEVGENASKMAALAPAAAYLQLAFNAFRKVRDPWEEHYDVALRLHQVRADVELSLNHFDLGYEMSQTYLQHVPNLMEKMSMYISISSALGRQDKQQESLELSRGGAQLLRTYPRRAFTANLLKELVSLKMFFRRVSDEKILSLPPMTDPAKLVAMKLLVQVGDRSYILNNIVENILSALKIIRLTFKSGMAETSAFGFSVYGIVCGISGDQKNARRFSNLAKQVLKRTRGQRLVGLVQIACCLTLDAWTEPTSRIVEGLRLGHTASMEVGEFEIGFSCWMACNVFVYSDGYPLDRLDASYTSLLSQMDLYNINSHIGMILEHANLVKMMIKKKAIDWEAIKAYGSQEVDDEHDMFRLISGNWACFHLAVHFLKYELAEYFAGVITKVAAQEPTYQFVNTRQLYNGITAAGRYRQTGKKKYLRQLRQARNNLKHMFMNKGNNVLHRSLILRAEVHSLKKSGNQWQEVRTLYDNAIDVSLETDRIHEGALVCELAGEYLIRCKQNALGSDYLTKAWGHYKEWGAFAKMDDLEQRRGSYIVPDRLDSIRIGISESKARTSDWPGYRVINDGTNSNARSSETGYSSSLNPSTTVHEFSVGGSDDMSVISNM